MFAKQGLDMIGDCCVWLRLWVRGNLASTRQSGHAWSVRTRPTLDAFIPAAGLENIQLVHVLRTHVLWRSIAAIGEEKRRVNDPRREERRKGAVHNYQVYCRQPPACEASLSSYSVPSMAATRTKHRPTPHYWHTKWINNKNQLSAYSSSIDSRPTPIIRLIFSWRFFLSLIPFCLDNKYPQKNKETR